MSRGGVVDNLWVSYPRDRAMRHEWDLALGIDLWALVLLEAMRKVTAQTHL